MRSRSWINRSAPPSWKKFKPVSWASLSKRSTSHVTRAVALKSEVVMKLHLPLGNKNKLLQSSVLIAPIINIKQYYSLLTNHLQWIPHPYCHSNFENLIIKVTSPLVFNIWEYTERNIRHLIFDRNKASITLNFIILLATYTWVHSFADGWLLRSESSQKLSCLKFFAFGSFRRLAILKLMCIA